MQGFTLVIRMITGAVTVLLLYQLIMAFIALAKPPRLKAGSRIHRFALVISARNEEAVIGNLIDSLLSQDYPRRAFDVFVITDNCTDRTAEVARARGARIYNRQNRKEIGKGFALSWFFDQFLAEYPNQYDAVGIFDADNLVDGQFLSEMNNQLCAGQVAVMGYRDSKNPYDTWVTASTSISFWFLSRFCNLPRERLGLSVMAGGTGYVFLTSLIADGWHTQTISEDLEFSLQLIARGQRVGYTPFARIYDEQPPALSTLLRQRHRWSVGTYQNIRLYLPALFRGLQTRAWPLVLDALVNVLFMPLCAIQLILSVLHLAGQVALSPVSHWQGLCSISLLPVGIGFAGMIGQALLTLLLEKKFSYRILKGVLTFPLFVILNGLLYALALATPKISWHPIEHKRSVSLSQIDRG